MREDYKKQLKKRIDDIFPRMWQLSCFLWENPELGNEEYLAVSELEKIFREYKWDFIQGIGGLETSFCAEKKGQGGPAIAFLAEYDALPEIGHGCGHNLICGASVGAGLVLGDIVEKIGGTIKVIGTPAEETTGGKVTLLQNGVFENIDVAMMFHPGGVTLVNFTSLALESLEFTFKGETGHPAGIGSQNNSLEALLIFFEWIRKWRNKLKATCQVQGVILEGGRVPNIIPERTKARFYIRAADLNTLDSMKMQICKAARDAALETKTEVEIKNFEERYFTFKTNKELANIFCEQIKKIGLECNTFEHQGLGSMDMGNISHVIPSIHPYLSWPGSSGQLHTKEFSQACYGEWGKNVLRLAIHGLVFTGYELFSNPGLVEEIKREHGRK